jgi:hypothetical protein
MENAGVDYTHPAIRWLCLKIARAICEWLKKKGDSNG